MLSESQVTFLSQSLSFYKDLTNKERDILKKESIFFSRKKASSLINNNECQGLVLVVEGQLRAYITSPEGKEITLYRLLSQDVCIMTAACMLKNINFDIQVELEEDSSFILVPTNIYEKISAENPTVSAFTLTMITERFNDVMWTLEQLVFSPLGKRLSNFLMEHYALEGQTTLHITHDYIARDLGTAREVISRLLKYLEKEGLLKLSRGSIELLDLKGIRLLA